MDIVEKVKDGAGKVAKSTKSAFDKAGNAVQKFSDKTVLRLEIKKLEKQKKEIYLKMGCEIAKLFLESKRKTVSVESEPVKSYLKSLQDCDLEIADKEKELSDL